MSKFRRDIRRTLSSYFPDVIIEEQLFPFLDSVGHRLNELVFADFFPGCPIHVHAFRCNMHFEVQISLRLTSKGFWGTNYIFRDIANIGMDDETTYDITFTNGSDWTIFLEERILSTNEGQILELKRSSKRSRDESDVWSLVWKFFDSINEDTDIDALKASLDGIFLFPPVTHAEQKRREEESKRQHNGFVNSTIVPWI